MYSGLGNENNLQPTHACANLIIVHFCTGINAANFKNNKAVHHKHGFFGKGFISSGSELF
jgi:hypothetical protein